jgi:hypothetical protein
MMIEADDEDNHSNHQFNQPQNAAQFYAQYDQMQDLEEEKEEIAGTNQNPTLLYQQRVAPNSIVSDNLERPQPYHPRQQQRSGNSVTQVPMNSGGSAVLSTPGSLVFSQ